MAEMEFCMLVSFSLWVCRLGLNPTKAAACRGAAQCRKSVQELCMVWASDLFLFFPPFVFFPFFFLAPALDATEVTEGCIQETLNQAPDKGSMHGVPRFVPCVGSYSVTAFPA